MFSFSTVQCNAKCEGLGKERDGNCVGMPMFLYYDQMVNHCVDEIIGIINEVLYISDGLLTKYFVFWRYWRKNGTIMAQYINCL